MLQIVGVADLRTEELRVDGYTFSIRWGGMSGSPTYWRTGDLNRSFLEIGYDQRDGRIVDVTLVLITEVASWSDDYGGITNLCTSQQRGLPACDANAWPSDVYYVDDPGPLRLVLGKDRLSIQLAEPTQVTSCISTDNVDFGLNANSALCVIEVKGLTDSQMALVRLAFPKGND